MSANSSRKVLALFAGLNLVTNVILQVKWVKSIDYQEKSGALFCCRQLKQLPRADNANKNFPL